jgi:hypothetical protein
MFMVKTAPTVIVCVMCATNWLNNTTYSTKLAHYFVYATYKTLQLNSPTSQKPTERKEKINTVHVPCNYIMFVIFNSHLGAQCFYLPIIAPIVFGPSCWPSLLFDTYSSIFSLLLIFTCSRACFTLRNTNMDVWTQNNFVRMYVLTCVCVCVCMDVRIYYRIPLPRY